jgi:hypothetical protein
MKELNRLQREREIELKRSEDEEWWKQRRGTTERSRRLANEDGVQQLAGSVVRRFDSAGY